MYRVILILSTLILSNCRYNDQYTYHDPDLKLTAADFNSLLTQPKQVTPQRTIKKILTKSSTAIPDQFKRPISINISQAIPLKDILLSMAQLAKVNIVVSPKIQGSSSLLMANRPFIEIIQEICDSYNLRHSIKGSILKIEPDTPYIKSYDIQFLIMTRSNQNRFSIATDVFTSPQGGQTIDDNGSNTVLTGDTKTDFWSELSQNLEIILQEGPSFDGDTASPSRFTIHKQGGLITVFASQAHHKVIDEYLNCLRKSVEQQVLIEAKIVEVTLDDQFKSGINWNFLQGNINVKSALGKLSPLTSYNKHSDFKTNIFSMGAGSEKISGIINLLDQFGTVRTLCNPRLTVINNQSAVLKSAENKVYFKLNSSRDYNHHSHTEQFHVTSDIKTVPVGLMIVVHPTVNHKTGKIIMTLRPSISRIITEVDDPAVGIASNQKIKSSVPQIQVRELDSVLAMNSGETIFMGGLMEEVGDHNVAGVPGLQDTFLGALFKSTDHQRKVTELVVFLKATIIESDTPVIVSTTSITSADQNLYQNFVTDNRPITFTN